MITQAEAKMRAAQLVLAALSQYRRSVSQTIRSLDAAVITELDQVERRLLRDSVGGDKILLRQMQRETGRHGGNPACGVGPPKRQQAAVKAMAKKRKKDPDGVQSAGV